MKEISRRLFLIQSGTGLSAAPAADVEVEPLRAGPGECKRDVVGNRKHLRVVGG
jgi:hypothetical protein